MIPHESKNILVLDDDRYGVSLTTKYALEDRFNVIRTEDYNNAFERFGSRDIDLLYNIRDLCINYRNSEINFV